MDEGVAQLFTLEMNNRKIIGTVGALQYEVIQYQNTNMELNVRTRISCA
jgi:peptide subunit release factor RF-3